MFTYTGDYVEQVLEGRVHPSRYYTFTPRPLMEGNFYTMDDELATLLASAHRILGQLECMAQFLPMQNQFSAMLLFKESCFSKMIDYDTLDIYALVAETGLTQTDETLRNIMSAYAYSLAAKTVKISYTETASRVLYGTGTTKKAHPRHEPIFWNNATTNYRQYNPTAPKHISAALEDINTYAASSQPDALICAAMSHYQFEIVHPYEACNGIIGRILIYRVLHNAGIGGIEYLALSPKLHLHCREYFEKLSVAQKDGDYRAWIEYFLQIILEAAQSSVQALRDYIAFTRSDEEKIISKRNRQDHTLEAYQYFLNHVVADIRQVSQHLGLSFNSTSRAVEVLREAGIIEQISDGLRNRRFAHSAMFQLITYQ